jgi:hypothetical protein
MRLFARKRLAGNLLQQAFPDPNAGNREAAQIQIAAEGNEGDRRDTQDVGAIAPHAIKFHAFADIAFQDAGQPFAQQ